MCRHVASSNGCYALSKWLIKKHHVDVNPVDKDGRTPLAVRLPDPLTLDSKDEILIYADSNVLESHKWVPMHCSVLRLCMRPNPSCVHAAKWGPSVFTSWNFALQLFPAHDSSEWDVCESQSDTPESFHNPPQKHVAAIEK